MAMDVGARKEGEPHSDINTTPLIDVMLVLLVMLIICLPPQRHAVKIDSPMAGEPPVQSETLPDPVHISVDFDGTVYWNGAPVDHDGWESLMVVESRRAIQPEIHIEPHKLAGYGQVAAVMASAQRLGLTKLGVTGGT